jgi:hypothetical protein
MAHCPAACTRSQTAPGAIDRSNRRRSDAAAVSQGAKTAKAQVTCLISRPVRCCGARPSSASRGATRPMWHPCRHRPDCRFQWRTPTSVTIGRGTKPLLWRRAPQRGQSSLAVGCWARWEALPEPAGRQAGGRVPWRSRSSRQGKKPARQLQPTLAKTVCPFVAQEESRATFTHKSGRCLRVTGCAAPVGKWNGGRGTAPDPVRSNRAGGMISAPVCAHSERRERGQGKRLRASMS